MGAPDAAEFDRWYAVVARSAGFRASVSEHLGLPTSMLTTGYLGGAGLAEVAAFLDLGADDILVDLGCGRAGHSLALARDTSAHLIGVDFSVVALAGARRDAAAVGLGNRTLFLNADLTATGLAVRLASGVVCVDALQFARSVPPALAEMLRVLAPGGRVAITTWQADPDDLRVPARIRDLNLARDLPAAGFIDVAVEARPDWSRTERDLWAAALAHSHGADPGLQELQTEASELLPLASSLRRVIAVAVRPG